MPESSGNYDSDIEAMQDDINTLYDELGNILVDVDDMLAGWEEEQWEDEQADANGTDTNSTDAIDDTTRWSLDAWTDYESYNLLDIDIDSKRIEDEDDYTLWLIFKNESHNVINERGLAVNRPVEPMPAENYLYYETDDNYELWQVQSGSWKSISFSSIYQPVEVREIVIQFSPKSSDRVIVDEKQTELYSTGYPSFDWSMDFNNRISGTSKRIEATTETRFTIPIPTRFINNDPLKPYPEQFKLEFELVYKH